MQFERTERNKQFVKMTRDLSDRQVVPDSLKLYTKGACSVIMLYTPDIILTFDTTEYSFLKRMVDKKFEDYYTFLYDNDIVESLYLLIYDSSSSIIRIDRISTDININFGDVVYSYFPDSMGRITSAIDWYCRKDKGRIVLYIIEYSGYMPSNISYSVHELD